MEFGENLDWTCANCPNTKAEDISQYTLSLFEIRRLRAAGYPYQKNDLTLEQWEDLGMMEDMMQGRRKKGSMVEG